MSPACTRCPASLHLQWAALRTGRQVSRSCRLVLLRLGPEFSLKEENMITNSFVSCEACFFQRKAARHPPSARA